MSSGITGTNWLDLSSTSNCYNRMYVQGFVDISGGNLIVRNNNVFITRGDLSLNGRLFVNGDVSLNNRLFLTSDASFGGRLYVASDASFGGRLYVASDVSINGRFTTNNIDSYVNTLSTWSIKTTLPTASNWSSITQTATGQYILASQNTGSLYLSSNYGASDSWATIKTIPSNGAWVSTSMSSDARYMLATTNGGGVYISPYYGASGSWVQVQTTVLPTAGNYMNSTMSSNGQYMMVANNASGGLYISTAYGASGSWGIVSSVNPYSGLPTNTQWSGLAMSSTGQYMFAAQNPGSVYMSYTYGQAWMPIPSTVLPTNGFWQNLSISSAGQYVLAANNSAGSLYVSSTFGTTWSPVTTIPTNGNWHDVNISSTGQYMMAANNSAGSVYYSSNFGANWGIINGLPTSNSWTALSISSNGLYMFAAISGGAIYSTITNNLTNIIGTVGINTASPNYTLDVSGTINTTQGLTTTNITGSAVGAFQQNWSLAQSFPTNASWPSGGLGMSSTGQYMLAANNSAGAVYLSTNYGQAWNMIPNTALPTNVTWKNVAISGTGQYMLAGINTAASSTYLSSNYGATWAAITALSTAAWLTCAVSSTGQYMLAGINNGLAYLNTNYGVGAWTSLGSMLPTNGTWYASTISSTGQYMMAGSSSNGVYYLSNNYGTSWSAITKGIPTSGIVAYQCSMSSSGQYMIAINNTFSLGNFAYLSKDFGVSWELIPGYGQYGTTSSISGTGQYMIISANGSGYIYYSTNYGTTWLPLPSTIISKTNFIYGSAMSSNGQYMLLGSSYSANVSYGLYLNSGIPITTMGINNSSPQYALDHVGSFNLNDAITSGTNFGAPLTWRTPSALFNSAGQYQHSCTSYNGQFMLAAMHNGGLWLSHDFGETFFQPQSGTFTSSIYMTACACSYSGQYMILLCGSSGATSGVYISKNYGISWTQFPNATLPTSFSWTGCAMSGTGQYMLACANTQGAAYLSINYGVTWTAVSHANLPTNYGYLAASMSSTGQYILVGVWSTGTGAYLSTNYGTTFTAIPASTGLLTSNISLSVGMSSTGQYMGIAMNNGTTYMSSNYGANWIQPSIPSGGRRGISISGTGQYMIASNSSSLFYSNTYGGTWIPVYVTSNIAAVRYAYISGNGQYMTIGSDVYPNFFISCAPNTVVGINNPSPQCELDVIGTVKNTNPYWIIVGTPGWQSIAAGGKIPFSSIYQSNAAAFFNTNTYTFTAPITGRYLFVTNIYNSATSRMYLNKNNSGAFNMIDFSGYANTPHNAASFLYLNAGDTIHVYVDAAIQVYFAVLPPGDNMHSHLAITFLG